MGAASVYESGYGMSMREALSSLQEEAREEYGHDYYNGRINNASLSKDLTHLFELCTTKKKKSDFIDEWMERADKGEVYGVCIVQPKANSKKITTKVTNNPQKGTRKWVTKYEVVCRGDVVDSANDQTTAIKKARTYSDKHKCRTSVEITKVLEGGNVRVASIEPIQGNSKQGKYIFFGSVPN